MSVKAVSWQAIHKSGTKFYHIITLADAQGNSAAVHHWGPLPLFSKADSVGLGQNAYEGFVPAGSGLTAGARKRMEKEKGGYTTSMGAVAIDVEIGEFKTPDELKVWCKATFSKDSAKIIGDLSGFRFDNESIAEGLMKELEVQPREEVDTAKLMNDNPEWGTW